MGYTVFVLMIVWVAIFQALILFFATPTTFERWWNLFSQSIFAVVIFLFLKKWWMPKKLELNRICLIKHLFRIYGV